jgi:hypothetical protein
MQNRWLILGLSVLFSAMLWAAGRAQAEITYQGYLRMGGAPANGNFDFIFTLYDAPMAGNQVGAQVRINNKLVRNGLYTVELDFGPQNVIWNALPARNRWLEIEVRPELATPNFMTSCAARAYPRRALCVGSVSCGTRAGDLEGNYPAPLSGRLSRIAAGAFAAGELRRMSATSCSGMAASGDPQAAQAGQDP